MSIEPHACPHCGKPIGSRISASELKDTLDVMRAGGCTDLASFDTRITLAMSIPSTYLPPEAQSIGSAQQSPLDDGGALKPIRPIDDLGALSAEDNELLYASSGGPPPEVGP